MFKTNEDAIQHIIKAIEDAGYVPGKDMFIALDCAASEFYNDANEKYTIDKKEVSSDELIAYYEELIKKYPIVSIEDPCNEDDWNGYQKLTSKVGGKVQIVGDDLYVTNVKRLEKGINMRATNSILIKLNQIGSVTETLDAIEMAKNNNMTCVVSHRSGESEDTFIADLVVATNSGLIKTGSLSRTDRIAKYNQLLRIEEQLGDIGQYRGLKSFYSIKK